MQTRASTRSPSNPPAAEPSALVPSGQRAVFAHLLRVFLEFSGSEFGFIGEVCHDGATSEDGAAPEPYLRAYAISDIAWDAASRELYDSSLTRGLEFRNLRSLIGAGITSGREVIANDPRSDARASGLPAGHPPLTSFLGLPLHRGDRVIGLVGLANRPGGYDEAFCMRLESLRFTAASLIDAVHETRRRLRAEESLRRSEERNQALLRAIPDMMFLLDERGVFLDYSCAAPERLLAPPHQFLGQSIRDVLPAAVAERTLATMREVSRTGQVASFEYDLSVQGASRQFEARVSACGGDYFVIVRDITEERQVEIALRESDDRFTAFMQTMPLVAFIKDEQGRMLYVNRAFEEAFERPAAYFLGKDDAALWPPETARALRANDLQVLESDAPLAVEETVDRPDGARHWISYKFPLRDARGRRYLGGSAMNITKLKEAERRLRESEERFRLIAETIDEVFWMVDTDVQRVLYVSPSYERVWGRSRESLYADPRSFLDAVHPEDRHAVLRTISERGQGRAFSHEYRVVHADGSVRWIWDRGFPVPGAAPPTHYVGVAQDITVRKLAEEQLRRSAAFRETIIRTAAEGVCLVLMLDQPPYVRFLLWNERMTALTGYTQDEINRLGWFEALHRDPAERERAMQRMWRMRAGEHLIAEEWTITRRDGEERTLAISTSLVDMDDGNRAVVAFMQDISERLRAEETRRRLESQLVQSQKMEAIGRLAGGVAHDFNNLLTVITGYSELLLNILPREDEARSAAQAISDASRQAAELTSQLLAFSRRTMLEPRVLDLNQVIQDSELLLRRLIGEDVALQTDLEEGIGAVRVDPGQIRQVLLNLVVNARDAMPRGGTISLRTRSLQVTEADAATRPGWVAGPHAVLSIRDTGCGMTPAEIARIFEPFYTTKELGKGTGLGLAVVQGIVEQSGGHIEVESAPRRGTTFDIYLPCVTAAPARVEPAPAPQQDRGSETILLVEDEAPVRELAELVLSKHGYTVHAAADGAAALELAERIGYRIDLLLTDVVMPRMDGRDLAEALRPRAPKMGVLYVSGYTDDAVVRHGVLQEQVAFLGKPYTSAALVRKVRQVLDRVSAKP